MSPWVWFAVAVVFLVFEGATTALVSIWFAVGALTAAICAFAGASVAICAAVFAIVSALVLLLFKKFYNKNMALKHEATNADRIIGTKGIVCEDIDPVKGVGSVKADGKIWSAKADECIEKDSLVKIESITGVKLVVKKAED